MGHSRSKITVLRACLIRRWTLDLLKNTENNPMWSASAGTKSVARGHPRGWDGRRVISSAATLHVTLQRVLLHEPALRFFWCHLLLS